MSTDAGSECDVRIAVIILLSVYYASAIAADVPPAYAIAVRGSRVPATLLYAVALQESGMPWSGRLVPWPWTLNVAGTPYRLLNRQQACHVLTREIARNPRTRIDIGLTQINLGHQGHRVSAPCQLLDPYRNLGVAVQILDEHSADGADWITVAGRYHRPAGGTHAARYRESIARRLDTLERSAEK